MTITNKTVLSLGSPEKDNIKILEIKLQSLKLYKGRIDGDFGPVLKQAVIDYQHFKKLYEDGIAGPITLGALGLIPVLATQPVSNKSAFRLSLEGIVGPYNSVSALIHNIKVYGEDWTNYKNDVYPLATEILNLKARIKMNCSDLNQLLVAAAIDLKIYEVHYIKLICPKSGEGHIIAELKGGEFTQKTWVDISAMLHSGYALGSGWCYRYTGDTQSFNARDPAWLLSDDGKT